MLHGLAQVRLAALGDVQARAAIAGGLAVGSEDRHAADALPDHAARLREGAMLEVVEALRAGRVFLEPRMEAAGLAFRPELRQPAAEHFIDVVLEHLLDPPG